MDESQIRQAVSQAMESIFTVDMHTHLFPPLFKELCLYGIDELLTYHYLVAEALRAKPGEIERYWQQSKAEQANFVWRTLFVEGMPISEACRGVVTTLDRLGIDPAQPDLRMAREYFSDVPLDEHVNKVLRIAGLRYVVMTNDPLEPSERMVYEDETLMDNRFKTAFRIDTILNDWSIAWTQLRGLGYDVNLELTNRTLGEIHRFLEDWDERLRSLYLAVSLPPSFDYPQSSLRDKILDGVVLPFCRERQKPLALMIGVRRGINPALRLAGDGVGVGSVAAVEALCAAHPENRFLVTMLSRENQHALAVAARKFSNLMIFGCWWFLNTPGFIEELTTMRMELLGLGFIPQHSDARVLEQLIYKWEHSREVLEKVLCEQVGKVVKSGWTMSEGEIKRDMERLLAGNFEGFVGV